MSLGLGIYVSILLIVGFLLFRMIGEFFRWVREHPEKKSLKKIAALIFGGIFLVTLGIWRYAYYENIPNRQTSYYGISLGMGKPEVTNAIGIPSQVSQIDEEATAKGWLLMTNTEEIPSGNNVSDYDCWHYQSNSYEPRIDITFDTASKKIRAIGCYSNRGHGYCKPISGITTGATEEDVEKKLGRPTKEKTDGIRKTMIYRDLNLEIYLEKKAVYMLNVTTS